jgi:hypothetical protein
MLLASSLSLEPVEPVEEGLEALLKNLSGLASRDFGAVIGENPEGGFEVLMTGGLAANSSNDSSSTAKFLEDG